MTSKKTARFRVELKFQGPLLSEGQGAKQYGLDASFFRYRGEPAISGSLVRGCLRHSLTTFVDTLPEGHRLGANVARWFGSHYRQEEADGAPDRQPGSASFDFAWVASAAGKDAVAARQPRRVRIALGDSGTVTSGMLQVIETPFVSGQQVVVAGDITLECEDDQESEQFQEWIEKALDFTAAMGALKGIGFGRLCNATVDRSTDTRAQTEPTEPNNFDRLSIDIEFDRPLLISGTGPINGNRVLSDSQVRGEVFKGAFAQKHKRSADQINKDFAFDELIFRNAVPLSKQEQNADTTRYGPLPLSVGVVELADGSLLAADLAEYRHALVVIENGDNSVLKLAKNAGKTSEQANIANFQFAPSWKNKHREAVKALYAGVSGIRADGDDVERLMVVRTAIQQGTNVADEDQLFSQQCVETKSRVWRAEIDLGAISADRRETVGRNLCRALAKGIAPVGKTRSRATITVRDKATNRKDRWNKKNQFFTVLLRSPARLFGTPQVDGGTNTAKVLHDLYAQYWTHASSGALILSHYFAQQTRTGGRFHAKKYRSSSEAYRPEWLTRSGSVFVLRRDDKAKDGSIDKALKDWSHRGLPPAADRIDDTWETDPYRRENGYGEVDIDHFKAGVDKLPKLEGGRK